VIKIALKNVLGTIFVFSKPLTSTVLSLPPTPPPHPTQQQQQPTAVAPDFFCPRLLFTIPHLLEKLVTALVHPMRYLT